MTSVFADTYYYLALLNPRDEAQTRACEFTDAFAGMMVTTDWVLMELANGLSGAKTRGVVTELIESLRHDASVRIVRTSRKLFERGWSLFRQRPDKHWSLTDCISFIVMRDLKITEALTGDRHFEQAGFRAILKSRA